MGNILRKMFNTRQSLPTAATTATTTTRVNKFCQINIWNNENGEKEIDNIETFNNVPFRIEYKEYAKCNKMIFTTPNGDYEYNCPAQIKTNLLNTKYFFDDFDPTWIYFEFYNNSDGVKFIENTYENMTYKDQNGTLLHTQVIRNPNNSTLVRFPYGNNTEFLDGNLVLLTDYTEMKHLNKRNKFNQMDSDLQAKYRAMAAANVTAEASATKASAYTESNPVAGNSKKKQKSKKNRRMRKKPPSLRR